MNEEFTREHILSIADTCMILSCQKRSELQWMDEKYLALMKKRGFSKKSETDRHLFRQIFQRNVVSAADELKIRYWRTGQHVPISRNLCVSFGKALELSAEDEMYLIKCYFDRCDTVYLQVPDDPVSSYYNKYRFMEELVEEYLRNIPEDRLGTPYVSENRKKYLRHLYYTDVLQYVAEAEAPFGDKHIYSATYASELYRTLHLLGEIPRKTMIRHLLVFGMPFLRLEKINEQLAFLGYQSLDEEHTLVTGERLDWLLIRLLKLYAKYCDQYGTEEGQRWMQESCRTLDEYFKQHQQKRLRFLYFKSLRE